MALVKSNERYQIVFWSRLEGRTYAEIANQLGVSTGRARQMFEKMRRRLTWEPYRFAVRDRIEDNREKGLPTWQGIFENDEFKG